MTTHVNGVEARCVVEPDWHLRRGFRFTLREFASDVMVAVLGAQNAGAHVTVQDPRMCGEFRVVTAEPEEIVLGLVRQIP